MQRTFLTGRSVELDAVLLAGCPAPAPDALPARDAKAGNGSGELLDPRVRLLVEEAFRHAKVIGAWGAGVDALTAAGRAPGEAGVVTGDSGPEVLSTALELLSRHRAWERFPAGVA